MRRDGEEAGGGERADDTQRDDRYRGLSKAAEPDAQAAFEQNHDESDRRDPLHVLERDHGREAVTHVRRERGENEQWRRRRDVEAGCPEPDADGEGKPGRDDQDRRSELGQLVHGGILTPEGPLTLL